jgi:Zn-dependent protease
MRFGHEATVPGVEALGSPRAVKQLMPSTKTRKGTILLFRFTGIDVFLHWSWFAVAVYEINGRGRRYPSLAWNIAEYLTLFLVVLLHEFGHALACRQVGGKPNKIVLWPLGGVAYVEPPPRPGATLWSIAAGPLVNVLLAGLFYGLTTWGWHHGWRTAFPHVYKFLWAVMAMNVGLLVFNLLPIYPLDGGQILRSLLWFVLGRARSLKVVAVLGFIGAVGLISAAVWLHAFWIGIISLYMLMNCWVGLQQAQLLSATAPSSAAPRGRLGEEYWELMDPKVQERVRARHALRIMGLQSLGFQQFGYRLEVLPSYSAISKFPFIPLLWGKEVLVFPKPARLAVANILLANSSPIAIAEIIGRGVRFYSVFSGGKLLISSSFRTAFSPATNSQIIQNPHCQSMEEAWLAHQQKTAELEAQGLSARKLSSFADYVEIEQMKLSMVAEA